MAEFDVVIIRGGPVMDGNRSLAFRADVGVRGGRAAGFRDRGALLEGMPADVVVYDLARLKRLPDWWDSEVAHDFPGGEWRRVQRAEDYHWTLVNEQRKCTGATPGKLLRHGSAS